MWRFCCPLDPQDGTPSCHRTRFTRSLHAALLAPAFARSALPRERVRSLCRVSDAGHAGEAKCTVAGVRKPPRNEPAMGERALCRTLGATLALNANAT